MFRFPSIKHKMGLGFSCIIGLLLILGIYNIYTTKKMEQNTAHIVQNQVPALIAYQQIAYTIANRISSARAYVASGDSVYKEEFQTYSDMGESYVSAAEDNTASSTLNNEVIDAALQWNNYIEEGVFKEYDRGNHVVAANNLENFLPMARETMKELETAAAKNEDLIETNGKNVTAEGNRGIVMIIIVISINVILGFIIAWKTSSSITNPLQNVMARMKEIASGNLKNDPLISTSRDEIGQLVIATNEMESNMQQLLHRVQTVSNTVHQQSNHLKTVAQEVVMGATHITNTMEELANGAEKQSASANDLSNIVTGLYENVQHTSDSGLQIQQFSKQVLDKAGEGTKLMDTSNKQMQLIDTIFHEAVQKVELLDTHSGKISELVSVIEDIAEQTNLLALNAAIEAARAGEHGQGFSVVANEVRKLAEEVANSVSNITDIVHVIQSESSAVTVALRDGYAEVEAGTKQVNRTKDTFEQINQNVGDMVQSIQTVADHLSDIESETKTMDHSFQEIAAISEESAASIEQTTAQAEETTSTMEEVAEQSDHLQYLALELEKNIARFKV